MGDAEGDMVTGLLHPGEMGAAVAGCLTARGHEVRWVSQGRGPATAARAAQAGLADAGTVAALAGQAGIILSVCPPHAALDTAAADFRKDLRFMRASRDSNSRHSISGFDLGGKARG